MPKIEILSCADHNGETIYTLGMDAEAEALFNKWAAERNIPVEQLINAYICKHAEEVMEKNGS